MGDTWDKIILGGLGGLTAWYVVGQRRRQRVWDFFDSITASAMEAHEKNEQARRIAQQSQNSARTLTDDEFTAIIENVKRKFGLQPDLITPPTLDIPRVTPITEADARWRDVIVSPATVLITGKRGSGKSAQAYRLLELFRYRLTPYVVGVSKKAHELLPEWIGIVPSIEDLPRKSIALVDEAYLLYHSRRSMAEANTAMSQLINLSRQRDQTLIFVSQEARQVDRNIASSATVLVFKDPGMLQQEFDRPELRKMMAQAKGALAGQGGDKRQWAYVYSPDADFMGLLKGQLPTFWKPSLSHAFASGEHRAPSRLALKLATPQKAAKAREMHDMGHSYSRIAQELGVSKATVVNYIKGYPYRPR